MRTKTHSCAMARQYHVDSTWSREISMTQDNHQMLIPFPVPVCFEPHPEDVRLMCQTDNWEFSCCKIRNSIEWNKKMQFQETFVRPMRLCATKIWPGKDQERFRHQWEVEAVIPGFCFKNLVHMHAKVYFHHLKVDKILNPQLYCKTGR